MTALFTSLTFEESRAFLQGLIQSKQPKEAQKAQVFYAANALIKVVYGLNLTWQNYVDAWTRLFQGAGGRSFTAESKAASSSGTFGGSSGLT